MSRAPAAIRVQGAASIAWGVALLARGRRWWATTTGRAPTAIERAALVALASRQLVQGLTQVAVPDRLQRTWLVVDLAHAGSMVLIGWHNPSRRRPALLSAVVAAASGAAALRSLRGRR